jgi:hypothetical protein
MKAILKLLKKYPASAIFYCLYLLLFIMILKLHLHFHKLRVENPGRSGISLGGEGVGFGDFFFLMITCLYVLIILINAVSRKSGNSFYLWFMLIVVAQAMVCLNVVG